ncbi:MAG TPA: hypothetical protein VG935_01690 [Patescibacteria group bacterium]|nr:hypothetical protein [Patescibacteria group bacterium]
MRKYFLVILGLIFFSTVTVQAATTPTPSAQPTSESATEKLTTEITDLKDKIASRVAQLKLVEKRGILGHIRDISGTLLTIDDVKGSSRLVDVDEITKFSSPSAGESYGLSDLKPGIAISIIGLYNKDTQHLLARFVDAYTIPLYESGVISTVDTTNYTVTLSMVDGKSYLVDIESLTKTTSYDKTGTAEKSGFSKIEAGTRAIVIGYADKTQPNRMVASRILLFPDLPKNPQIIIAPNAVDQNSVVTSTGSGKKLTPLK